MNNKALIKFIIEHLTGKYGFWNAVEAWMFVILILAIFAGLINVIFKIYLAIAALH